MSCLYISDTFGLKYCFAQYAFAIKLQKLIRFVLIINQNIVDGK